MEKAPAECVCVLWSFLYIHILLINIPYARLGNCEYIINTIIYSLIFITYAALRLRKFYLVKHKLLNGNTGGSLMKINIAFFLPALIIFLCIISLCFTGKDNPSDKNSISDIKQIQQIIIRILPFLMMVNIQGQRCVMFTVIQ